MKHDTTQSVQLSDKDVKEAITDWLKKQFPGSDGWEVYLGTRVVPSDDLYERGGHSSEPCISASRKLK